MERIFDARILVMLCARDPEKGKFYACPGWSGTIGPFNLAQLEKARYNAGVNKPTFHTCILFCALLLASCASPEQKVSHTSTAELKLRHQQCVEYLNGEKKDFEFKFGPPMAMAFQGNPREDRIKEKENLEKELFRRWQAGDKEAFLPIFGKGN